VARRKSIGIRRELTTLISSREIKQYTRWSGVVRRRRKIDAVALFWAVVLGFSAGGQRSLAGRRSVSRALRSVWREGFSPGPERRQARRDRVMERGVIGCGEQRPYGFSGGRRFGSSRATRRGWT